MKTENLFKNWIENVPHGQYNDLRKEVITKCFITKQQFRNWKNGITEVPELAKEKINLIAGRKIYDL